MSNSGQITMIMKLFLFDFLGRKFYIEKSKNKIPLIKTEFLRLEKKIIKIFVRK